MRKRLTLSLSLILGSAVFTPAGAAPITYCSSSALKVCSAFEASTMLDGGGKWHLILKVWNAFDNTAANGLSHAVTFAGIGSSWVGTATLKSAKFNGNAVSWAKAGSINNNVVGAELDFAANTNGINAGLVGCGQPAKTTQFQTCLPGGPMLVLDFQTSSQFTLTGAVYGWHSQAINSTGCSLWADSNGNSTGAASADCATTVTPEPVTVVLLGTGMAGMALIRRRRKQNESLPTA